MPWKRSDDIKFPSTWLEFVSSKSGRKYWIQDIPNEYKDIVASYSVYTFAKEENLLKHSLASTYPNFLITSKEMWRKYMDQNVGLICLTKDECGEIQIAGFNCLCVSTNDEEKDNKDESPSSSSKVMKTYYYVIEQGDAFKKLNADAILMGMGLYVMPEFRGDGIGVELLKAREPLCKALGLKTSCTVFTSIFSQIIAEKAGFKDLYAIDYKDLAKISEDFSYLGVEEHTNHTFLTPEVVKEVR